MQEFVMTGAAKQDYSEANEYKKIISLPFFLTGDGEKSEEENGL